MREVQTKSSLQSEPGSKTLTWCGLLLRIIAGFLLFTVAGFITSPYNFDKWSIEKKIFGYIVAFSVQFVVILGVTALIAVIIARVPRTNKAKPLTVFLNYALWATLIICGLLVYGWWYAAKDSQKAISTSTIGSEADPKHPLASTTITMLDDNRGATGHSNESDHFSQYYYPNDGFEASFPSKPLEFRTDRGPQLGYVNSYQAVVAFPMSQYSVFVDHSPNKTYEDAAVAAYLDGIVQGLLKGAENANLKYTRMTRVLGFPAKEYQFAFTIKDLPFDEHGIVFLVDGNHIRLSYFFDAKEQNADKYFQRFIGSFRLVPIDAPLGDQKFEDKLRGITLTPPDGWKKGLPLYAQIVFLFSSPAGHSITVLDSGTPLYVCDNYDAELKMTQGITSSGIMPIGAHMAAWSKSTAYNPTVKIRMSSIHYCLNTQNGAVILIGAAPEETFFRSEVIFRKVAESMVVRK